MKRSHDECVEGIKRRCIDRLSVKRKLVLYPEDPKKTKTDYNQGLFDGKKMAEDACYYFFTYSYNGLIKTEVERAVNEIRQLYESIISELEVTGKGTLWVY